MPEAHANIQINSPNGGEVFLVGEVRTIQWVIVAPFPTQDWDLFFSTVGSNGPWIPLVSNLPINGSLSQGSVHTYNWTVPVAAISNTAWVRVIQDNSGLDFEDVSNGSFVVQGPGGPEFQRGDTNDDGNVNIADAIYLLGNLFPTGAPNVLGCLDAADCNADSSLNIADAIALLAALFGAPPAPLPAPYPGCGDADLLGCDVYSGCP